MEAKLQQASFKSEKAEFALNQKVQQLENEKKNLSAALKVHEEEKRVFKDREAKDHELAHKVKDLTSQLSKIKDEHKSEIDKIHHDYKLTITNMRTLHTSVTDFLRLLTYRLSRKRALLRII